MYIHNDLGNFIYNILYYIRDAYQDIIGIQLNIDFNNDVMLALFSVLYILSIYFIIRIAIALVKWFYRL